MEVQEWNTARNLRQFDEADCHAYIMTIAKERVFIDNSLNSGHHPLFGLILAFNQSRLKTQIKNISKIPSQYRLRKTMSIEQQTIAKEFGPEYAQITFEGKRTKRLKTFRISFC